MTDRKKISLVRSTRIFHAEEHTPEKTDNNSSRGGVFLAAAIIALICAGTGDNSIISGSSAGNIAYLFGSAAAKTELISLTGLIPQAAEKLQMLCTPENKTVNTPDTLPTNTPLIPAGEAYMISCGNLRMPSSVNEEQPVEDIPLPDSKGASPLPYPETFSDAGGKITALTYSSGEGENYIDLPIAGQIRNNTALSREEVTAAALKGADFTITPDAGRDEPQVLIMHTHTTESYEPYARDRYDPDYLSRTTDSSENMTAVGDAMTEVFEARGISTIHDTTIHDYPAYNGSYDRSRETVIRILEKYPSIKVVLDIHRDAIEREDGERIAPTVTIDGRTAAQVMIICGCDDGTMGMPDCMKNLGAAADFQQHIEERYPGLTRPVLFDYRHYNQDLSTGSLLIEVGGHANSIDQAIYAGEMTAEGIADALLETSGQ